MRIEGVVVHGKQLGRTIGFPTANVQPSRPMEACPDGVYAAYLEADGRRYRAMVNIGRHPTLPGGGRTIEAHIIDFSGDLYGRSVVLEIAAFIRSEVKFSSPETLREQLERDKLTALELLNG